MDQNNAVKTGMLGNAIGLVGIGLVLVGIAALWSARTYSNASPTSFRSFSVAGDGKAIGVPDVAAFNFQVITEGGNDIASLQSSNTSKANAIIGFLKTSGIDAKDIQTASYSVDPRYQNFSCPVVYGVNSVSQSCPPAQIAGYTVSQSVNVKVRDFSKIGGIMTGIVSKGANSVSQLSFKIDDPSKTENEARDMAIAKAKAKAEDIANAGGFSLGRLLEISESTPGPIPYPMYGLGVSAAKLDAVSAPSIQPGSQEVNVTVSLRYEIQ